ncbi:SusC/RagA family TonB-linked outer membrane protein [Gaoshiqia sp. Z1-71]|uniref:SusC/RagA family TonB-linked outer membrane protein n=1 Tax=Gaoshiqia hydrogeniformans TaxID=3290090 RepID=UPI003BF8442E
MKKKIFQMLFLGILTFLSGAAFAQFRVNGVIKSADGEFLPGAAVMVKGTTIGVLSDVNGEYTISSPNAQSVLVFSFVGMQPQEIPVDGRSVINATLKSLDIAVDEVVVTALGISREKKSLGYSVSSVSSEDMSQAGNVNMLKSLDGKVTGVNIVSLSSDPTSSALITIRGATTIAGISNKDQSNRSQPLYVIDGIPVGSGQVGKLGGVDVGNKMSQLNPSDIESVTILKGASAGALYGSEAGNGVILITTKSGAKGKKGIGVEVTSSLVLDNVYKTMPVHQDYFQGERYGSDYYSMEANSAWGAAVGSAEAAKNYTQWDLLEQKYYSGPLVKRTNEDRIKAFMETGTTVTNNVSITGNYDKGNYRLSFTNLKNTGVIPNNSTTRNTVNFSGMYKLTDNVSVTTSFSYTKGYTPNKSVVAGRDVRTGIIELLYSMSPNMAPMSEWRKANTWIDGYEGIYQNTPYMRQAGNPDVRTDGDQVRNNNPYWVTENNIREFVTSEVFGKVELNWQIIKPLSFLIRTGGDLYTVGFEKRIPYDNRDRTRGEFEASNNQNERINTDLILTFNNSYGKFDIIANAGYNYRFTYNTGWSFLGQNLLKPNDFRLDGLNKQTLNALNYSGFGTGRYQSVYGTASVGFNKMLYLDITGRNDWSGITEQEVQKHFYPSASLSWLLSETFDLPESISLLKLRAGWAQVGFGLGIQQNRNTYGFKNYSWSGASLGTVGGSLVDPNIKPEINESFEYGIEASMFKNRVLFDFTIFTEKHLKQINTIPVVSSTGFSNLMTNVGTVEAKGWEGSLTVVPVRNNDWTWSLTGNISTAESEITYMHPKFTSAWYDYADNSMQRLAVGEKMGNLYAKEGWWVVKEGEFKGMKLLKWSSGTPIENDEASNRDFLGNWNPDYIMGLSTNIRYKRFRLSMVGSFRKGGIYVSETTKILRDDGKAPFSVSGDHHYWEGGRVGAGGFAWPNPDNIQIPEVRNRIEESYADYNDASYWIGVYVDPRSGAGVEDRDLGNQTWNDNGVQRPYYILNGADPNATLYNDPYSIVGNTWDFPQTRTFDATNFKLKEVTLSYDLPVRFTQKFMCQGGTFSLVARNVYFWTKSGQNEDPESAFTGTLDNQGVARFIMPQVRSLGFELYLNF